MWPCTVNMYLIEGLAFIFSFKSWKILTDLVARAFVVSHFLFLLS